MNTFAFDDFDAFAASVQDVDLEIMIRNPGRRRWSLKHLEAAGLHLQQGYEGGGGIAQGQSRADTARSSVNAVRAPSQRRSPKTDSTHQETDPTHKTGCDRISIATPGWQWLGRLAGRTLSGTPVIAHASLLKEASRKTRHG